MKSAQINVKKKIPIRYIIRICVCRGRGGGRYLASVKPPLYADHNDGVGGSVNIPQHLLAPRDLIVP